MRLAGRWSFAGALFVAVASAACAKIDLDALSFACESSSDCAGGKKCHPTRAICVDPGELGFCGDGARGAGEECDDGNLELGDGCDATCTIEQVTSECGDGVAEGEERCDDGDRDDGDGCNATCIVEPGWTCLPERCFRCGDGLLDPSELCDDGELSGACVACERVLFGWECVGDNAGSTCTQVQFSQIAAGGYHTCGIDLGGALRCGGKNDYPGAGFITNQSMVPADFPALGLLVAGHVHTCGIAAADRSVHCFGANIGIVSEQVVELDQAVVPGDLGPASLVAGGALYTCALDDAGFARCWGQNGDGQASPPQIEFDQLGLGNFHGCGRRRSDQKLTCWGLSASGRTSPPDVQFAQVSSGFFHSCGVSSTGQIECWGRDSEEEAMRTYEPPGTDFVEIYSGHYFNCARRMDGSVICWGLLPNAASLATVPEGSYRAITAGGYHACGLREDQTVVCWGVPGGW